mmetsp:Transcript_119709/g.343917  ORF Transcript_119709/g.343917 Transcript_119709/m.343917 type:complete len:597 (+) Transcript_119709:77-1867(+)|eukprot:CAMPEP_0170231576 /NCGR_PEP_ID=MMETSP0116_2-20130129/15523_1 /TAXON_ID=400756 /ORGANISM="Durinskia baltica, Strain CSIRO CS-38" /LENGTH=596 /DNA_ID=CAMNT_0010482349 /DNA_START=75 /DNA_END=1865 /DNA_ORIENTATION=-
MSGDRGAPLTHSEPPSAADPGVPPLEMKCGRVNIELPVVEPAVSEASTPASPSAFGKEEAAAVPNDARRASARNIFEAGLVTSFPSRLGSGGAARSWCTSATDTSTTYAADSESCHANSDLATPPWSRRVTVDSNECLEPISFLIQDGMNGHTACVFTLVSSCMGVSMLTLPQVCAATGLFMFVVLMATSCVLSCFTAHLMFHTGHYINDASFVGMGRAAFGRFGSHIATLTLILQTLSVLTSFLIYAKTMVPILLFSEDEDDSADDGFDTRGLMPLGPLEANHGAEATVFGVSQHTFVIGVVGAAVVLIVFPLCMVRKIRALIPICYSTVSIFFIVVASAVAAAIFNFIDPREARSLSDIRIFSCDLVETVQRIPSMLYCFACQGCVMPVYASLRGGNPHEMDRVAVKGLGMTLILFVCCGVGGYVAFPDEVMDQDSLLAAFPPNRFSRSLQLAVLIAVFLCYPCAYFGLRHAIMSMLFGREASWPAGWHFAITLGIVGFTFLVATVTPNLKIAFAWIGATVSIAIMYVFPTATFIGARWRDARDHRMRLAFAVLVWGFLVMGLCIGNNIMHPPHDDDEATVHLSDFSIDERSFE